jgi:hypothetical protein
MMSWYHQSTRAPRARNSRESKLMATSRCKELLGEFGEFGSLTVDDQAARLAQFMSAWYSKDHKLDTIDGVRLSQRLRSYASRLGGTVGDLMMGLLKEARAIHELNQAAHLNEDLVSQPVVEPVYISHPDASNEPVGENVEATPLVREYQHPGAGATPVGDAHGSPPEPIQEPTIEPVAADPPSPATAGPRSRSRSRPRPTTAG